MSKEIHCDRCLKEIRIRGDLVTATSFFKVVPYHEDCYARDIKGAMTLFVNNQPINGFSGNFLTFLAIIIFFVSLFVKNDMMFIITIMSGINILYRFYSYFVYERYLEK
ncbi:hypothetical protein [Bacillus sp. AFS088145]|uniref:hypothetical protein n=1 Tax=Bacillus sp. AFS088145 TaxID=2033514 RepID=UPI000BF46050|nr:hypothetical protein [Bacillus sp. AFS088145]PFH82558.1 hypothetical protein COI44_19640 [Bacillus sp. AFS088145]